MEPLNALFEPVTVENELSGLFGNEESVLEDDEIIAHPDHEDPEVDDGIPDFCTSRNGVFRAHQGYLYRRSYGKKRKDGSCQVYWRCLQQQNGCSGRLDCSSLPWTVIKDHCPTCQPSPETILKTQTIAAMKKRCRTETTFVTRIYEDEKNKVNISLITGFRLKLFF